MYHCDDCGREGTPRMVRRVLVCYCGSVELRWLPVTPAAGFGITVPAVAEPDAEGRELEDKARRLLFPGVL